MDFSTSKQNLIASIFQHLSCGIITQSVYNSSISPQSPLDNASKVLASFFAPAFRSLSWFKCFQMSQFIECKKNHFTASLQCQFLSDLFSLMCTSKFYLSKFYFSLLKKKSWCVKLKLFSHVMFPLVGGSLLFRCAFQDKVFHSYSLEISWRQ